MSESKAAKLKALIRAPKTLVLPGAPNAYIAAMIEQAGFDAVYVTGAGVANMTFGLPDLGLLSLTEVVASVEAICRKVDIPVLADMDTGFGNALNVYRSVQLFEQAGAAGIQLEDQVTPKRCGHFDDKAVIETGEMLEKIAAVHAARRDPELVLVARTDALAVHGIDAAIERAQAYADAGADMVFIEAPRSREDLARIARAAGAPVLANMVEGGKTPLCTVDELQEMGFAAVLFANTALRVAGYAMREALRDLRQTGTSDAWLPRMLGWEERQAIAGLQEYLDLSSRFAQAGRTRGER